MHAHVSIQVTYCNQFMIIVLMNVYVHEKKKLNFHFKNALYIIRVGKK